MHAVTITGQPAPARIKIGSFDMRIHVYGTLCMCRRLYVTVLRTLVRPGLFGEALSHMIWCKRGAVIVEVGFSGLKPNLRAAGEDM